MQIKYNSDWLDSTIELMKCLEDINKPIVNEEIGSIDYIIDDNNRKKLIRALVDENKKPAPAFVDIIRATVEELEEEKHDEAVILSNRVTKSAYDLVKQQENLDVITPKIERIFSLAELMTAIQKKTNELCKLKCGKAPETKDDCKGKKGRKYTCNIRRIIDDATFHATMKWHEVLTEDFYSLCELERTFSGVN